MHKECIVTQTQPFNFWRNLLHIASYDTQKVLLQKRGIISLVCFTLVWLLILAYPVKSAVELMSIQGFKEFVYSFAHASNAAELLNWDTPEFAVYWFFALYLFPMFSLIITADQFSSDRQRGTLRFFLLRTNRSSLFFGRFLAQMIIQGLLILISIIATIGLIIFNQATSFSDVFITASLVWLALFINLLPYTALMSLLSLYANGARQASMLAVFYWVVLTIVIGILSFYVPQISLLELAKPGVQIPTMLNSSGISVLHQSLIPIFQTVVLLTLGCLYMQRRAL
nr:ABC transporter permease subunit [Parashewanella hymeniacidonis]